MSDRGTRQQSITTFNPNLSSVLTEIEEGHYLFIISDRKKAFLFLFSQGDVVAKKEIMDPGVRKETRLNSGELYGRNDKLSHHIDNQLRKHFQLIIQESVVLIQGKHINGVFLGGHKPLFHLIERELPASLQKKLRGDFLTELNIPEEEIIKHCKQVLSEYITQ